MDCVALLTEELVILLTIINIIYLAPGKWSQALCARHCQTSWKEDNLFPKKVLFTSWSCKEVGGGKQGHQSFCAYLWTSASLLPSSRLYMREPRSWQHYPRTLASQRDGDVLYVWPFLETYEITLVPVGHCIYFLKASVQVYLTINVYFRRTYFLKTLRNSHLHFSVVFCSQEISSREKEARAQLFLLLE